MAGIALQLGQQVPASLLVDQSLQPLHALRAQPAGRALAEPLFERRPRRTGDPLNSARGLDPLATATNQHRLAQLLVTQLGRTDFLSEPSRELAFVAAGELPKPVGEALREFFGAAKD